jgi:importin-5
MGEIDVWSDAFFTSDWRFRHAALMAISATGEGLTKSMEKHLDEIVKVLQQSMNDPVCFLD